MKVDCKNQIKSHRINILINTGVVFLFSKAQQKRKILAAFHGLVASFCSAGSIQYQVINK
jgi:hypothetical protein